MFRTLRPFFITLIVSWAALLCAAVLYERQLHYDWIITAALPAFLLESVFYLASMFEGTRGWLSRWKAGRQATALWISALMPYVMFSELAGTWDTRVFLVLAVYTAVLASWYAVAPRRLGFDLGFIAIAAAPVLLRVFKRMYVSPDAHFRVDVLGHLMVIRVAVVALLVLRGWNAGPTGLWPKLSEWKTGAVYYAVVMLPLAAVGLGLGVIRFAPAMGPWWRIVGVGASTFFGILWVVAFSEELLFRGLIERALLNQWRSEAAAIGVSAVLFGSVHLWFRHFPDWQWMILTIVLGVACGSAYARTGTIRTPMVTHALVVTTWRLLFSA